MKYLVCSACGHIYDTDAAACPKCGSDRPLGATASDEDTAGTPASRLPPPLTPAIRTTPAKPSRPPGTAGDKVTCTKCGHAFDGSAKSCPRCGMANPWATAHSKGMLGALIRTFLEA